MRDNLPETLKNIAAGEFSEFQIQTAFWNH